MTRPGSGSGPDDGPAPGPPAGRFATVAEWAAQINGTRRYAAPDEASVGRLPPGRGDLSEPADPYLARSNGHRAAPDLDRPAWYDPHYTSDPDARPGVNGHRRAPDPSPAWPTNGHRAPDPADPAVPTWAQDPPPTWPTNGHRPADPADPAVPTWAQDPPPTWPTNGHRPADPADPAVPTWAQDPPPTWPTNGHRPADPADPAVPTWAQDPPPTWPTNGRAADPDAAEWVREWPPPAPPSNGHRAPDPARPAWADEPGSWPADGRADDPDPRWDGGRAGHGSAPGGPRAEQPRPQPNGYPDHPEDSRRPTPWPYAARADDAGLEPDTLSGWDAMRYSPPPVVRRPANGHAAPPDERPGAASAFTLDPGARRVGLPAASPAPPLRPATRPPAPPQPDPVPVRAEPLTAEPLSADGTQLLHRYVPAKEMLDREDRGAPVRRPPTLPKHPPRAVVRRRRVRRRLLEWPFLIVFALLSAYLIRAYVVQTFYIPSGSMHETLLEGDRVLVNKVGYHLHEVSRGDVVVFRRPPDFPVEDEDLIKRVVALPGETVEGRGGQVYVDGRALRESYVEPRCSGTEAFGRVTVPPGTLWVMGDNRCNSSDSRVFGPVSQDLLVGRAFVLAWPFARLSWL